MSFQWNDSLVRKLIEIVKCNSHLYDKTNKLFKDIKVKCLTWDTVAKSISSQCTGEEASRKFKSLRDTFAKEHRKQKNSAGRSGDGMDSTCQFNSSWEFYYELLFLVEYITERRSSISNIVRKSSSLIALKKPSSNLGKCKESQADDSDFVKSSLRMEIISNNTMDSGFSLQESCRENSEPKFQEEMIFSSDVTENKFETSASETTLSSQSFSPVVIQQKSSMSSIRKKAMNSLKVPTSNLCMPNKKKKKNSDDEIQHSLNELTKTAMEALKKIDESSDTNTHSSTSVDPYAQMIGCALQEIPKEKKFRCISVIMNVLDIYSRGKDVIIEEKDP